MTDAAGKMMHMKKLGGNSQGKAFTSMTRMVTGVKCSSHKQAHSHKCFAQSPMQSLCQHVHCGPMTAPEPANTEATAAPPATRHSIVGLWVLAANAVVTQGAR
jgi:hypothetical protein